MGGGGLCSDSVFASTTTDNSSETAKQKWYGSGFLKQERSGSAADDDFSHLKLAKTSDGSDFSSSRPTTTPTTTSPLLRSDCTFLSDGQQMLCFSQSDPQTAALPYYYHASGGYGRNTGYGAGNLNVSSMHGVITGIRGPFTPSQWMELEHQALIYKYITANVPIPSHLLIPIRKALDSVGFSGLRPNPLGWGAFHLGFSNNSDPEPGRCRRTDGKKWRCSRDAVPDSKYCERHMNRGRHRSRKPVEGQTTAAAAAATHHVSGAAATSAGKPSTVASSPGVMGPAASTGLAGHQISNLQTGASLQLNRNFSNDGEILELSPAFGLKQNQSEFGLVSSDSLLNPLQKTSTLIKEPNNPQTKSEHHSLRQFMDDWPPNNNNNNQTELSISIPITTSDFITSSNDKLALSPLRLSNQRQPPNWIPVSWEGGPLGEVLHNGGVAGEWKDRSTAALNLMTEGWDSGTSLASSPTGVLQKTAFGSLSNSSAGSSPRTETGMCNNQIHRHSWPALN